MSIQTIRKGYTVTCTDTNNTTVQNREQSPPHFAQVSEPPSWHKQAIHQSLHNSFFHSTSTSTTSACSYAAMSETETKSNIQNDPLPPSETSRGISTRDGNVSEREITQNQNPQATDNATENQGDVAAVVTKGTRAAKFLWMLLHSQVRL